MHSMKDTAKTLDELDPPQWGLPSIHSYVVKRCHALRSIPIADFDAEDLRLMIGQGIGLQWLIPLAIRKLQENPLIESAYYEGDLLKAVLEKIQYHPEHHPDVLHILNALDVIPNEIIDCVDAFKIMTHNTSARRNES